MAQLIRDELAHGQLLRALGYAPYGGADVGECLAVADRVTGTDLDQWFAEWSRLAERLLATGRASEAAGDTTAARSCYLRASNYFRTAGVMLLAAPIDPRVTAARAAEVDAFRRAAALLECPPERVEVTVDGHTLTGYFFRPADDGQPRPTLILTTGYDGSAEELYFANAAATIAHGYNAFAFEGPGQGSVLIEDHVPIRPDWEAVVTPIVDALVARPDVDPDRIGIVGLSLGGYLAPRAAAVEHRLAACVSDCGPYDVYDAAVSRVPGFLRPAIDETRGLRVQILRRALAAVMRKPTAGWALRRNLLVHGLSDPLEYFRVARQFSLKGKESAIVCPTFVATTDQDDLSAAAPEFFEKLTCEKHFVRFLARDGAGDHCEAVGRVQFHQELFDWLDTVMAKSPAAGFRPALGSEPEGLWEMRTIALTCEIRTLPDRGRQRSGTASALARTRAGRPADQDVRAGVSGSA